MEHNKRDSISENISKFCHIAKEHDFMEVTDWSNGEGFDITLESERCSQMFSLTHGEMDLLTVLTKMINIKEL